MLWDLLSVKGDRGGDGAPGARLQEAAKGPLVQSTFCSPRLLAAPVHGYSRAGTMLCSEDGAVVSTEKKH